MAKTTISKTTLSAGENLTIQSELQYGNKPPIEGWPAVLIEDENKRTIASWYLNQQGTLVQDIGAPYQIANGDKFTFNINWDPISTTIGLVPGRYTIRPTIFTLTSSGKLQKTMINQDILTIMINMPVAPKAPNWTQTDSPPPYASYAVLANTTISKTTVSTGESITIHSELQYIGTESPRRALPQIAILDNAGRFVASWHLNQQGTLVQGTGTPYQIAKGDKFTFNVSWNLKDTYRNIDLPSGQYGLRAFIQIPLSEGRFTELPSNQGSITITINP